MQSFYDVILSPFNAPVAGAQVFVYKADGTLATLYDSNVPLSTTVLSSDGTSYYISEDLLSPISNPIVTGADGKYLFFAANGVYSIIIVAAGYDNKTLSIELNDPSVTPFVQTVNIQEFTTVGTSTWTKPVGARYVEVLIYGGGGGGGSGRRRSASTANAATGGAGGGAGARVEFRVPATNLANTETVVVGAGGIGGAAQTINETDGIFGGTGGNSQFGSSVIVIGGSGGSGGSTSLGGISAGVRRLSVEAFRASAFIFTSNGGNGNPALGSAGSRGGFAGGGGGGGSGFAAGSTTSQLGRAGGLGGAVFSNDANNNTGGGGAAGAVGGDGGNGANAPAGYWVGGSGGGSGGCTSTQAGSGGVGGYPSGGGAGGAAASDAFNSGAGGDGGDGYVRVVTYL